MRTAAYKEEFILYKKHFLQAVITGSATVCLKLQGFTEAL